MTCFESDREPIIAQRYLPEVRAGDKRVILVEGEAVGALNRVPAAGDARANVHVGGTPEAAGLTDRDLRLSPRLGPHCAIWALCLPVLILSARI